jgi:hypothetical protein
MRAACFVGVVIFAQAAQARLCNYNQTDPNRDGRCAAWAGLEPIAVQDPAFDKMLCYWPDPAIKNPSDWQSAQAGRADPVNSSSWQTRNDTSGLPDFVKARLSPHPYITCSGSENCCFRGTGGQTTVLP